MWPNVIWSHLLKKNVMENFTFCAVKRFLVLFHVASQAKFPHAVKDSLKIY